MSESPKDFKGPFVAAGRVSRYFQRYQVAPSNQSHQHPRWQLQAKPGKGDEVAQILANLKARADSDVEPGTLMYEIVRFGDEFAVWEK